MLDQNQKWPSGTRDTTEFPIVDVIFDATFRDHLEAFLKLDGLQWTDYDAQRASADYDATGSRLRTYRKLYERLGLIYNDDDIIKLSRLGTQFKNLKGDLDRAKEQVLSNIRITATSILARYQLRNPVDAPELPDTCDVLPYVCIWKAMRQLDDKLHYEEINRVIMHVMRMSDLDEAIDIIRSARSHPDYLNSDESLEMLLGSPAFTDQPAARIAPWYSMAGWGGLLIEQKSDKDGYRHLVSEAIPQIDLELHKPHAYYQTDDKVDWQQYYIGSMAMEQKGAPIDGVVFTIKGTPFDRSYSRRYVTSMLAKPFVILTGNSGTGKTRIAKRFAEYLQVTDDQGGLNWLIVSVGADWTDNTRVLGYYNSLANKGVGKYEKTKIVDLIERANAHPEIPYFLILDEMNLSHVERYFSDFLSHMEIPDDPFELDGYEDNNGRLLYPANLFVTGTVNIDETTYMFSPKVLDRANVVEFKPEKDAVLGLFNDNTAQTPVTPAPYGMAEAFYQLAKEIRGGKCSLNDTQISEVKDVFALIYDITEPRGYEFAYRTVKEIKQYISAAYELADGLDDAALYQAIDEQLLQKILPKIHGNRKELSDMLEKLSEVCKTEGKELQLSETKIEQMKDKLSSVQYASFI